MLAVTGVGPSLPWRAPRSLSTALAGSETAGEGSGNARSVPLACELDTLGQYRWCWLCGCSIRQVSTAAVGPAMP
eukprot:2233084-Rhodomonas_salina.7